MTDSKVCIGIDISKLSLDCFVVPARKSKQFANSPKGIKACLEWICNFSDIHRVIIEPSGGYENPLLQALQKKVLPVSLVNARYIHHFGIALKDQAKTDTLDAQKLAIYGQVISPPLTVAIDEERAQLKALINRRKNVQDHWLAEKNRLEKDPLTCVRKSLKDSISFLEKQIRDMDLAIKKLIENTDLKEYCDMLIKTKGIGLLTAANLLAELQELGTYNEKQIAKIVGIAPMNNDSGKFKGQRHIRGGRKHLRNALYMTTLVAVRCNEALKTFYQRLLEKGKPKKVALIASMRKLLTWLNAQMQRKMQGKEFFIPS